MEVPLHMRTATLAHRMALWLTLIALAGCQTAAPRPDYDTLYKAADDGEPVSVEELRDAFLAAPDFDQRMDGPQYSVRMREPTTSRVNISRTKRK